MDGLIAGYIDNVIGPLTDPTKRIFLGYLTSALLIALGVQFFVRRQGFAEAWRGLFSRQTWWSRSARADYTILLINQVLMMGIVPRLISTLALATILFEGLHRVFDGRVLLWPEASPFVVSALFTVTLFLLDDFSRYAVHRALHRWPVLWSFHKVHHSAESLTPFTVFRTHPVEGVIFALRSTAVQALAVAVFMYFFGNRFELLTALGANVFLFAFNLAGSNLRHSPVWISYGARIETWLMSPAQHQIHHSVEPRHFDRNFGVVLSVWDRLGGTLCLAGRDETGVTFGIGRNMVFAHDLASIYVTPFREAATLLIQPVTDRMSRLRMSFSNNVRRWSALGVLALALGLFLTPSAGASQTLNIYSHRQPFLIQPFIDAYTAETGTQINIVYASKGLAQRLQMEGERSPADLILTVDIARLHVYADKDLLAPVDSDVLQANVPAHLRDPGNRWFAFSKRARLIVVAKSAADAHEIKRYEDLADPKWRGRVCSRPGSHVYNRALIASMINAYGPEKAEAWAQGVVDNLARRPQGNDRAQVKAIYEGVCDIAVINNYYYGKLKHGESQEHRDWAAAVDLIFPNQADRGTHINISGGGVAKYSQNKEEAVRFLEFLTEKTAQHLYGDVNFEYPVNPAVPMPEELASWGTFAEDKMPISRIADLAPEAQKIIDRVGW
ncbi:MAG: extracellular solute-binding protein [Rhodospirillales bacterium]